MSELQSHISNPPAEAQGSRPPLRMYHCATGECVIERVVLANTALTRLRGLLGRCGLAPDEALWLRPCNGVHTLGMLFAIDVVFLDQELRIVRLIENLRPFRFTLPQMKARSALEMAAHSAARLELKTGDQLRAARTEKP